MILSLRTRINLQELEDIIANDDTGFAREDVLSTHICDFLYVVWLVLSIRVAHLLHEVVLLLENVVSDTSEVGVL